MANGMGSLWVAASSLQNHQNAINITANNISNVDTTGYVRQQVLFGDKKYIQNSVSAAISKQTAGLGVSITDVIHNRDVFLDQSYRTEVARQIFYQTNYEATAEVEDLFQEMNGNAFQEILSGDSSLWVAFQEFVKDPSSSVNQTLVFQKASLFVSRAQSVYSGLIDYQQQLNTQVSDTIDRINELGKQIYDLNINIQKIEAGGIETAMTLRDERDLALDELASLVSISYKERASGEVLVSIEGQDFVTESAVYEMGKEESDDIYALVTPVWPQLDGQHVFDLTQDICSETNSDLGKLKALVLARGDKVADYRDMFLDSADYADLIGASVVLNSEAEFDNLAHAVFTKINDLLCPNTSTQQVTDAAGSVTGLNFLDADGNVLYQADYSGVDADGNAVYYLVDADGNRITTQDGSYIQVDEDTQFWDSATGSVGSDGKPHELFERTGCDRYTELTGADGTVYYLYNPEDATDTSRMYTVMSVHINGDVQKDSSLIPYLCRNGEINYGMAEKISEAWKSADWTLNPTQTGKWTFAEYYEQMIGELGTNGTIFRYTSESLEETVETISSRRDSVIGVSSDEELTNMIRYQNGYNAASRYMNVVSEMIEHIIESLG